VCTLHTSLCVLGTRILCTLHTLSVYTAHMTKIQCEVNECDQCGWRWIQRTPEEPESCPKRGCRSRQWNSGKVNKPAAQPKLPEPSAGEIREKLERIAAGIDLDSDRETPIDPANDPEPGGPLCPACQEHILVRHKDGWGCNDCNLAFTRTDRRLKGWL